MIDVTARRHGQAAPGADARRRAAGRRDLRHRHDRLGRGRAAGCCKSGATNASRVEPSETAATADCIERYLRPEPRVRMGMLLSRNRAATACMDLSDGLADAAHQIADASGVGVTIDAAALPIDPAARAFFEARGLDAGRRGADRRRRLRAAARGPSARARPSRGGRAARRRAADAHRTLHGRPAPSRCSAAPSGATRRCRRATVTFDDSSHARARSAAGWTRCCTSTTRRSGPRRRSRSASSSASRRSSACTRCSAIVFAFLLQPQSRRGAARRLLEPAVDHRALLRVRDDGGRDDHGHACAAEASERSSSALFELSAFGGEFWHRLITIIETAAVAVHGWLDSRRARAGRDRISVSAGVRDKSPPHS